MSLLNTIQGRATYANVMSTIAVFGVLAGGGAYAAVELSSSEKKTVKRIAGKQANKEITERAPALSVEHADSADAAASASHADDADNATVSLQAASAETANEAAHAATADALTGPDTCAPPIPGTGLMDRAGAVCIDRYEASIWTAPDGGIRLTTEAQIDAECPDSGQPQSGADCEGFFARSVHGVEPAHDITWFQAQQALANSGKRLPTNAEWQQAVSGTPDSNACNVDTPSVVATGASAGCVSRFGVHDMVGNLAEMVGDWDEFGGENCGLWGEGDGSCFGSPNDPVITTHVPHVMIRGGAFRSGTEAGPLAVSTVVTPLGAHIGGGLSAIGFRGVR
jgi:hypothetical protein